MATTTFFPTVSSGGGLTLIQRTTVSGSPLASTITYSGLDGDTDGWWLLRGSYANNGGVLELELKPNALATNMVGVELDVAHAGVPANGPGSPFTYCRILVAANACDGVFTTLIRCSRASGRRKFITDYSYDTAAPSFTQAHVYATHTDVSANYTSLQIVFHQAGQLDVGSDIALYKVG